MARSAEQTKDEDGYFGPYSYVVGADPAEVAAEVTSCGVSFLPQSGLPPTDNPSTGVRSSGNSPPYKEMKLTKHSNLQSNQHHQQQQAGEHEFGEAAVKAGGSERRDHAPTESGDQIGPVLTSQKSFPAQRPEAIQHELALRLGQGDAVVGWEVLGGMTDSEIDQLTAQQRRGTLTDSEVWQWFASHGLRQ